MSQKKTISIRQEIKNTRAFMEEVQAGNTKLAGFAADLGNSQLANSCAIDAVVELLDDLFPEKNIQEEVKKKVLKFFESRKKQLESKDEGNRDDTRDGSTT